MADRGPWYTHLPMGEDVGINVYNDLDDNLVAYSRPYGYSKPLGTQWAVYERSPDGSVWSFTTFREYAKVTEYLTRKFRQKAS